jgi:hypothetical protein
VITDSRNRLAPDLADKLFFLAQNVELFPHAGSSNTKRPSGAREPEAAKKAKPASQTG